MNELKPAEVQSWYRVITDFPGYYDSFRANYNALLSQWTYIEEKHPELLPQFRKLVDDGARTQEKLNNVKDAIDSITGTFSAAGTTVGGWLNEAQSAAAQAGVSVGDFFRSAGSTVKGWFGLSGLGIIPIIWAGMAVGTAAGILIAVGNWLTSAATFASRVEEAKRLEASGMSPQQVTATLNQRYGAPSEGGSFFGVPLKWLLIGGIALILLPTLLSFIKPRR